MEGEEGNEPVKRAVVCSLRGDRFHGSLRGQARRRGGPRREPVYQEEEKREVPLGRREEWRMDVNGRVRIPACGAKWKNCAL